VKEVVKVKERKLLKKQTFFSGAASLMIAGLYFCPDFPFDRKIHAICLFAALMYFSFFAFFESFKKRLNQIIFWMSVVGIVFLTCVIHFSGGIASPFTFIYFCIIISEYVYGGSGGLNLTAISASSYALMVLGEYAGFLDVSNDFTRSIYESPLTTAYIVLFIVLFMFVVGDISRLIILKLRLEIRKESREKRSVERKFLELSSYSQIGMFAHRIAHDVRGLVFAMKSHFQMFKPTSEEESRENKFMLENLDRVGDMINQVTKYGKPSEEKKEKIPVIDFLENMIKVSLLLDEAKNVSFERKYYRNDLMMFAYKSDLQKAFFNLFKNAIEAVKDLKSRKRVDIFVEKEGNFAKVSISDTGPGMTPEAVKNAFKNPVTTKKGGTGVGLLIVKNSVENSGGTIEIAKSKKQRTVFVAKIPLVTE